MSARTAANRISSHAIYKLAFNDEHSMKLKARTVLYGIEYCMLDTSKIDCSMCSPTGMHLLLLIASLLK